MCVECVSGVSVQHVECVWEVYVCVECVCVKCVSVCVCGVSVRGGWCVCVSTSEVGAFLGRDRATQGSQVCRVVSSLHKQVRG